MKDLQWKIEGGATTLTLVDEGNQDVMLGPFPTTLVNLALAYAADGRVLTATMTTADPLPELRILLQPVLLDTTLGCHAIELDRFVDVSVPTQDPETKKLTPRGFQSKLIYSQQALYAAARASLIKALLDHQSSELRSAFGQDYDGFAELLTSSLKREEELFEDLELIARVPSRFFSDPSVSPLVAKQDYYHQAVVRFAIMCAERAAMPQL